MGLSLCIHENGRATICCMRTHFHPPPRRLRFRSPPCRPRDTFCGKSFVTSESSDRVTEMSPYNCNARVKHFPRFCVRIFAKPCKKAIRLLPRPSQLFSFSGRGISLHYRPPVSSFGKCRKVTTQSHSDAPSLLLILQSTSLSSRQKFEVWKSGGATTSSMQF